MELLVPYDCNVCGLTDEAKFTFSGPHIKQICNGCGRYVKFFSKSAIPDVQEIKLKIWAITQDTSFIEAAKEGCGFVGTTTGFDLKIMYWRLYLQIRKMVSEEAV